LGVFSAAWPQRKRQPPDAVDHHDFPMTRTLTTRELNRALLARQMLLKRARLSIPKVLDRMGGLQAQYAPAMYVGLWSRTEGMKRVDLTYALVKKTVVQGTLLRATIHLVSAADYWPWAIAIRKARRQWWLRVQQTNLTEPVMFEAAEKVRALLTDGPKARRELEHSIGKEAWGGVGLWLDLVRVPPSGTWEKRRADMFGTADTWITRIEIDPASAQQQLVRRYLSGFGPSTRNEIAEWSGLSTGAIDSALASIETRHYLTEDGKDLFDLPRAPLPDPATTAPVRFIHVWDAMLLVHARRTGILLEEHRKLIFNTKTPQSVPTFLVDGTVAGTWRYEAGKVEVSPFDPLPRTVRRQVEEEAEGLAAFHK
jgi:hypothetical protein